MTRSSTAASRRKPLGAALLASVLLAGAAARAEEPKPHGDETASAEALFQAGKQLMSAGNYAEACPKLAESQRLDPGGGTLTALAFCHEKQGMTASAWAEFMEAAAIAKKDRRPDRQKVALAHASALEPNLSRLSIVVPPAVGATEGFQLLRDGGPVGTPSWGSALPIDPGEHVVEARAAGKKPWKTSVTVGAKADMQTVTVPTLEDAPAAPAATTQPAPATASATTAAPSDATSEGTSSGGKRIAGFVVGGIGLVSIGVGSYFGVDAISKSRQSKSDCSPSSCTDRSSVDAASRAKTDAIVSDVTIGVGIAAVAVGAYLVFTSRSAKASPGSGGTHVTPLVGHDVAGVALEGGW